MNSYNHYQTLKVSKEANQEEIRQAYRRLVKCFHPDTLKDTANHESIININAAYEVLKDPKTRRSYDHQIHGISTEKRDKRTAAAQKQYQKTRKKNQNSDFLLQKWLDEVYAPVNQLLNRIIEPLEKEIEELSGDPFDDLLMETFCNYIEISRHYLLEAKYIFTSLPNPAKFAYVAADIYYCINQISDGIEELETFTLNYDDSYIHTGIELFRIARRLQANAQTAIDY